MSDITAADKTKALDQALSHIEKQYGKGSIMRLGADEKLDVAVIPSGCLSLDLALGIGGVPRGRVIEIYGPESSGKTTLALHVIAEAQRRAAWRPSSTPNTPWTWSTPASWGSGPRTCSSPSPTPASRPWRSPKSWCAPTPWTWWWWTRWPPWCPAPRSKATWATPRWAPRPASCPRPCASSPRPSASP